MSYRVGRGCWWPHCLPSSKCLQRAFSCGWGIAREFQFGGLCLSLRLLWLKVQENVFSPEKTLSSMVVLCSKQEVPQRDRSPVPWAIILMEVGHHPQEVSEQRRSRKPSWRLWFICTLDCILFLTFGLRCARDFTWNTSTVVFKVIDCTYFLSWTEVR